MEKIDPAEVLERFNLLRGALTSLSIDTASKATLFACLSDLKYYADRAISVEASTTSAATSSVLTASSTGGLAASSSDRPLEPTEDE